MAHMTIRLVSNPRTGKRDIIIVHESDADALPFEHEREHRALVERLLGQGVLRPDEVGQVRVRRVAEGSAARTTTDQSTDEPAVAPESHSEGS